MGTYFRGNLERIRTREAKHKKAMEKLMIALKRFSFNTVIPKIMRGNMATMKMEFMVMYLT